MTDIRSCWVVVNGLNIHYLTGGAGKPLIIIHGGSDGASAWQQNIEALAKNYTVYVPDLPGFGLSELKEGSYSAPAMVDFVNAFARTQGLTKFHLMGHSYGGGIAVHFALRYPAKIIKLVLVSSLCLGREIAWWIRYFANPIVLRPIEKVVMPIFKGIRWLARVLGPWELVFPVRQASFEVGTCMATLTRQTFNLRSQLNRIKVPTLLVWGDRDPVVPYYQAYCAGAVIPDCQVKVFAGEGHSVYRERLTDFSTVLMGFLG